MMGLLPDWEAILPPFIQPVPCIESKGTHGLFFVFTNAKIPPTMIVRHFSIGKCLLIVQVILVKRAHKRFVSY